MWICICAVRPCLCVSMRTLCLPVHVCLCVREIYGVWPWKMICLTAHVLAHASLAPSKKTSYSFQTPLPLNRRSRRRKRRAAAKLRPKLKFLWTTAVSRCCLFFSPLVQSVTFCCFCRLKHVFLPHYIPSPRLLCPGAQAHWSSLHPHLCSALQVSASGTERPGTTVSKQLYCVSTIVFCLRFFLFLFFWLPPPSVWCSCRMKTSPPSVEDSARAPLRTTNYKLGACHRPPL